MHLDRRLLARARFARGDLAWSVACGGLAGGAVVAQADRLSHAIDAVFLGGADRAAVLGLLLGLLAAGLVRAAASWASAACAQRFARRVKLALRGQAAGRLAELGPAYLTGERTGELVHTLSAGVEALDAYLSQYLPQLALAALVPLLVLAAVAPVDPLSGLVLALTFPLVPLFMYLIGAAAQQRTRRQWRLLARLSASFLDALQGLTTLKLLGRSADAAERLASASERLRVATLGVLRLAFLSALVLEALATLATAVVAVEVGLRLLYGRLGFREALFVLVLAPEFYRPLRGLGAAFHAGMAGEEAAPRLLAILEAPTALARPAAARPVPAPPLPVVFEDVGYAYAMGGAPALDGVSLRLEADRVVALVGPSGAGKTTLASLLLGFLAPGSGRVSVAGTPLVELDPEAWRRQVAWVPQRPHAFHGSVLDNLRLARPEATPAEVEAAARLAHAHAFIELLPERYATRIGERGARLSGGELQRLALARAFLKDAPLLVLDEPTAQLDPESEAAVSEALRRLVRGRSVLLIAHRLATVREADEIVLLERGRVVERGAHTGLVAAGGLYARLVAAAARTA